MYRNISESLLNWKKQKNRKPLILIGARQVGKTYSVREFAFHQYKGILEYNFQDDITARTFFSKPHSAKEIAEYLEINNLDFAFSKEALIFFDEVQLCPELLTSLKFLPDQLECDFICSGSMLGVKLHEASSWPVGYVQLLRMYPMTFVEFIRAAGIDEKYISILKKCIETYEEIPEALHDKLNRLFKEYMVCGGLPEAVSEYISGGIQGAVKVNRRLANDYRIDIAHYADPKTKIKAQECFDSIPDQLAKDNKKFQYNVVKHGYNARFYAESLNWLENAGLVTKTYRIGRIDLPLKAQRELGVFKVYMFDSGILAGQFSDGDIYGFLANAMGMYKGLLYENIAAQLLNAMEIDNYYYEPNTSSEIDFIIEMNGQIVPVEIKSGINTKSRSFDNFIKNHSVKNAYRFSSKNIGISEDGIIKYLPIYTMELAFKG